MNGWIKIHREITDHWIFQDDRYFKWWITILLNVNHEIKKFPVNGELVTCNPGESFRSVDDWTGLLNCHKKTLYKFFELLENDSMIVRKTLGKGNRRKHLLSVVNWGKYQEKETGKYTESAPEKYTESVPLTRMNKNEKNINVIFEEFRVKYPGTKRGLKSELENFLKKNKPEIVNQLLPGLEREIQDKDQRRRLGIFCPPWKHLRTWINQRCWEQSFEQIPFNGQPQKKTLQPVTDPEDE